MSHGNGFLPMPFVVKKFDKNGKFEKMDIQMLMSCYAKGKDKSLFDVKQKITAIKDEYI